MILLVALPVDELPAVLDIDSMRLCVAQRGNRPGEHHEPDKGELT